MSPVNDLGQPIGETLDWKATRPRSPMPMEGRFCRIEPLNPDRHAVGLHVANLADETGSMWTYMPYGPFGSEIEYRSWCMGMAETDDPFFYAIVDTASGRAVGVASYLRIEPALGVIEVGHIAYSPLLQRTASATEAMYLMMSRVFDELGYRRYEWKCDALNEPSRRAADRLGFTFEGIFRQATMYKGRNRDTAWYSVIDDEWPDLKERFEAWLAPSNINEEGVQGLSLSEVTTS